MKLESQSAAGAARLTAYALGELEGDERRAVEAWLYQDGAAREAVAATRRLAAQLELALADEAIVSAADRQAPLLPAPARLRTRPWSLGVAAGLVAALAVGLGHRMQSIQPTLNLHANPDSAILRAAVVPGDSAGAAAADRPTDRGFAAPISWTNPSPAKRLLAAPVLPVQIRSGLAPLLVNLRRVTAETEPPAAIPFGTPGVPSALAHERFDAAVAADLKALAAMAALSLRPAPAGPSLHIGDPQFVHDPHFSGDPKFVIKVQGDVDPGILLPGPKARPSEFRLEFQPPSLEETSGPPDSIPSPEEVSAALFGRRPLSGGGPAAGTFPNGFQPGSAAAKGAEPSK
jgi:hypothetical protein